MPNNDLASRRCVPCEGGTPPLDEKRMTELMPQIPLWELEHGKLTRTLQCIDFKDACAAFMKVALVCEEAGHHADIHLTGWRNIAFSLSTHAIQGLSENDFIVAAKINTVFDSKPPSPH
jgi:4a-hydroxytetrahydrobiopterin dehydratase